MAGRRPGRMQSLYPLLKFGLVFLVAVSAALMALFGDASLAGVAVAGGLGLVFGLVVVWFAFPAMPRGRRGGGRNGPRR